MTMMIGIGRYAPESCTRATFNHASDVWSFGVTIWEMYSYGETPFPDLEGREVRFPMPLLFDLSLLPWNPNLIIHTQLTEDHLLWLYLTLNDSRRHPLFYLGFGVFLPQPTATTGIFLTYKLTQLHPCPTLHFLQKCFLLKCFQALYTLLVFLWCQGGGIDSGRKETGETGRMSNRSLPSHVALLGGRASGPNYIPRARNLLWIFRRLKPPSPHTCSKEQGKSQLITESSIGLTTHYRITHVTKLKTWLRNVQVTQISANLSQPI